MHRAVHSTSSNYTDHAIAACSFQLNLAENSICAFFSPSFARISESQVKYEIKHHTRNLPQASSIDGWQHVCNAVSFSILLSLFCAFLLTRSFNNNKKYSIWSDSDVFVLLSPKYKHILITCTGHTDRHLVNENQLNKSCVTVPSQDGAVFMSTQFICCFFLSQFSEYTNQVNGSISNDSTAEIDHNPQSWLIVFYVSKLCSSQLACGGHFEFWSLV